MVLQNLINLVSTGDTILHGSPKIFSEVRPRKIGDQLAVCATVVPEIALYHALLLDTPGGRKKGTPGKMDGEWSFYKQRHKSAVLKIRINQTKLDFLLLNPKLQGYIYPMDTYDFDRKGLAECRLGKSRFLRTRIAINENDLPFTPIPGQLEYKLVLPYRFKSHFCIES